MGPKGWDQEVGPLCGISVPPPCLPIFSFTIKGFRFLCCCAALVLLWTSGTNKWDQELRPRHGTQRLGPRGGTIAWHVCPPHCLPICSFTIKGVLSPVLLWCSSGQVEPIGGTKSWEQEVGPRSETKIRNQTLGPRDWTKNWDQEGGPWHL